MKKDKKTILFVFVLLVFILTGIICLNKFASLVKGETQDGFVQTIDDLSFIDKRIEGFPFEGEVYYLHHDSLGRTLMYFSGEADSDAVEHFCTEHGWWASGYSPSSRGMWEDFPKDFQGSPHLRFSDSEDNIIYIPHQDDTSVICVLFLKSDNRAIIKFLNVKRK